MAGPLLCCLPEREKAAKARSRYIDKTLAKEKMYQKRLIRILLLGTGESGKSTFLKQMRIIHGKEFDESDKNKFKRIIYCNIVKGCRVLVDATMKLHINWGDPAVEQVAFKLLRYEPPMEIDEVTFLQFVDDIKMVWTDAGVQAAFDRRREYQLGDSIKYFLDNLNRISEKGYSPSKLDILHARKATKTIVEHSFDIRGVPFTFIDVGGQRSQRQKWYQCFEGVTSILFLTACSEFDQVLMEDRTVNRLVESINIFDTIINNRCFRTASVILFLNKFDLLVEKIKRVSISDYFFEFEKDPSNIEDVKTFLVDVFDARRKEKSKPLFHHFTTAIDTENMKMVFMDVKDTILQHNLESLMLH